MNTEEVVVITGATSGIGSATARRFGIAKKRVVLVGRNYQRGEELASEISKMGGNANFFKCDVSDEGQVENLSKMLKKKYGQVDVLFNNAGIMFESKEIENLPEKEWETTFATNLDGIFYTMKYLKVLITKSRGCVVNNASIAGMQSYVAGRSYAYSASKAAVIQFTRQMALNYAEEGIRVNCICPGIIDTPILGKRDRKQYVKRIPLGYIGHPEEVANVVFFLASEQASYLTGVIIPIDGGVSL